MSETKLASQTSEPNEYLAMPTPVEKQQILHENLENAAMLIQDDLPRSEEFNNDNTIKL